MKKYQRIHFLISFSVIASFVVFFPKLSTPCTSFVLQAEGIIFFGTNFDNNIWEGLLYINKKNVEKMGWEPSSEGEVASWISKYGSVTFNSAGYQLPWAGMNEAGLVISTMALGETENPSPDERPPLVSSYWMQYILDTCATVDEVMATDQVVRIKDTVDHYLIGDRNGGCATIEYLDGKMVCHKEETLTAKALTNLPYAYCVGEWKKGPSSNLHPYHSVSRFSRVADKLATYNPAKSGSAVDYSFAILKDVAASNTNWSIVFDTKNRIIHYNSIRNKNIRTIDLNQIDFSCETTVKMQDVHADLTGDITGSFYDFDTDISMEHLLRALKKYEIDVSEEQVREVFQMIIHFPCVSEKK